MKGRWAEGQRGLTLGSQAAHPHPRSGFRGWRAVVCAHHVFASPSTWRRGVLLPPQHRLPAVPPPRQGAGQGGGLSAGYGCAAPALRSCSPHLDHPGSDPGLPPKILTCREVEQGGGAGADQRRAPSGLEGALAFHGWGKPRPKQAMTASLSRTFGAVGTGVRRGLLGHGFPAVRVCAATKWQWRSEINLQAKILGHTQRPLAWQARFDQ